MYKVYSVKKHVKRALSALMAVSLILSPISGEAKTNKKKTVTKIQLTSPYSSKDKKVTTTLTLKKGSTFKIKSGVSPKSASKKLTYKSSKKKIATVSKSGKIKAKKVGKTKITIRPKKNKKVKATITVTVVKKLKKVKKISLNQSKLSLSTNGNNRTAQLKATITSPKKPTVKKFNWFTSNKTVATVNKKGIVTAKKAGSATITVTSADGRGAKAVCKVTVTNGPENTSHPSGKPSGAPSAKPTDKATNKPTDTPTSKPTDTPANDLAITVPGTRTGIMQNETVQLTATGLGADKVTWSVTNATGVTISAAGLLSVASTATANETITVTATTSANVKVKTATASFKIIENATKEVPSNLLLLNPETPETPLGLTYRSKQAYSKVQDPERGEVIRFDSSKGYTANSYDVLAWVEFDPALAGKTLTLSAYMKYEDDPKLGKKLNLLIQERGDYTKIGAKYDAEPDTWYHLTGTYTFPDRIYTNEGQNKLYITRDTLLPNGVNAVYYIDDLQFTVEKGNVEGVNLTAAGDATTIYQNHELQFTSEVTGTNKPIQKVTYSITPAVQGASIDDKGLLKVGNVPKDTKITVKAASIEDPDKFATKEITVLAQTIDKITVTANGSPENILQGGSLQFKATVEATGEPSTDVKWSVSPETTGVTISNAGLLTVADTAEAGKTITVTATSVFDSKQTGTYQITIQAPSTEPEFKVEYYENFDEHLNSSGSVDSPANQIKQALAAGILSYSFPTTATDGLRLSQTVGASAGVLKDDGKGSTSFKGMFDSDEDYVNFALENKDDTEKNFTLSFLLAFNDIDKDTATIKTLPADQRTYQLPLKLIDAATSKEIKTDINLPLRCGTGTATNNREYHEISCTVSIPANATTNIRLVLNGALPTCISSTAHNFDHHACTYLIDNILITSGPTETITLSKDGTKQLELSKNLNTGDTISYYTNSQKAYQAHTAAETTCTRIQTIADVDNTGLITAKNTGETILVAKITYADGAVERKVYNIKVK